MRFKTGEDINSAMILKSKQIKAFITALFAVFMIFMFETGASAAIEPKINYGEETITLTGGTGDGVVKYMYCPNVNPELSVKLDGKGNIVNEPVEKKKMAAEKWYPVYGDTIDISGFIPGANEIKLAFRNADEFPDADGVYKSRVLSDYIPCRPAIIAKMDEIKKSVEYTPQTEMIDISDAALAAGYEYKIGISGWQKGHGASVNVSSKYNALGGTVIIKKSASETGKTFASAEYKMKIPIAPPTPKLKISNGKIKGINLNQVYATSPDGGDYKPFKSRIIDVSDIENQLGIKTDGKDYIDLYIKTPATDKKPSSPIQKLHIDLTANKK